MDVFSRNRYIIYLNLPEESLCSDTKNGTGSRCQSSSVGLPEPYRLELVYSRRKCDFALLVETFSRKLSSGQKPNSQIFCLLRKVYSIILLSGGDILPVYQVSAPACSWMPHSRPASSRWAPPHLPSGVQGPLLRSMQLL